ncbi:MAG: FAD:protein FMN transferase [Bacteroidales bacterium]|nr:FAD:protein FMN transferase [Bacteroidales bacterium]
MSVVLLVGCMSRTGQHKQFFINGTTQGSSFSITYVAQEEDTALVAKVNSLLDLFDKTFSLWNSSSILTRSNRGEDVVLNELFIDLFNKSQIMSKRTEGYFDITVKPLVSLYGFAAEKRTEDYFSDKDIASILSYVGYEKIRLNGDKLKKDFSQIQLDFNAIAQGYCSDKVAELLLSQGIRNFLVDIGGEIVVRGKKPNGDAWKIGIEKPTSASGDKQSIVTMLPLSDGAIVTSGNYRKYFEVDGKRFSHTINPHTGRPATGGILSATIIAPTGWEADALATAVMCMEKDTAICYVERAGTKCMLIYDSVAASQDVAAVASQDVAAIASQDVAAVASQDVATVASQDVAAVASPQADTHHLKIWTTKNFRK